MGTETDASKAPLIGLTADRIHRFAQDVERAHTLGIQPGQCCDPWGLDFQRSALPIFRKTLPLSYLQSLSAASDECADLMLATPAPHDLMLEWSRLHRYLRSLTQATREALSLGDESSRTTCGVAVARPLDPYYPAVLLVAELATLVSEEGAFQLKRATGFVAERYRQNCPLSTEERLWLKRLANGDRVLDVADDLGFSERTIYRRLSSLWDRLGVDNQRQGIVLAASQRWLDD